MVHPWMGKPSKCIIQYLCGDDKIIWKGQLILLFFIHVHIDKVFTKVKYSISFVYITLWCLNSLSSESDAFLSFTVVVLLWDLEEKSDTFSKDYKEKYKSYEKNQG